MMNYEMFAAEVIAQLKERMPDAEIEKVSTPKNNGVSYDGIIIKKSDSNIAPSIYLDSFFDEYEDGHEICDIVDIIIDIYKKRALPTSFDISAITDWNIASKSMYVCLVNKDLNKDMANTVKRPFNDLYITVRIHVNMPDGEGSVLVKKDILSYWDKTEDEIIETALKNSASIMPARITNLGEYLGAMSPFTLEGEVPVWIVSNEELLNGASAILYDGVLSSLADKLDDDLYVIPSSIHECLVCPRFVFDCESELIDMIKCVNATELRPEEILSDHPYIFLRENATLIAA